MFREFALSALASDDAYNRDVVLAWRIEFFARQEKLKSPEKYLAKRTQQRQRLKSDSVEQHRAALEMLSQMYGGKLRKTRLKRKTA